MDLMRYNFTAPVGKHFGVIQSLADALDAIPNVVDYWTPRAQDVTVIGGSVSEWRGKNGRTLVQSNAARRPSLDGGAVFFGDGAGAAKASLVLGGTALGAVNNLTVAGRFRVPTAQATADLQYLFGSTAPVFRTAYRYTNSNNYLRFDMSSPSTVQVDADIAADVTTLDVIMTVAGSTALTLHVNDGVGSGTMSGAVTLAGFALGALSEATTSWRGHVGKFGIWRRAATPSELTILQAWLRS